MKELISTQEKAKRYDEAIKKVNDYYEGKTKLYSDVDKTINYLFPEFEEEKSLLEKFKQAVYDCAWGKVTCKKEGETKEEYANRWAEHFLLMVRDWADDYIDFTIQQKLRNSYEKGKTDIIEKQGEQKPTDNVKPKYKVGDWIVCCDYEPEQIIGIRANAYYEMSNGDSRPFYMIDNNHNIRLWTLADAKDGDILRIRNLTFIFQEITNDNACHKDAAVAYCSYLDNDCDFGVSGPDCITDLELITPATKEQRNLLFQKMHVAGYVWYADKKKLKESLKNYKRQVMSEMTDLTKDYIKQKSAWSENDERIRKIITICLEECVHSSIIRGYERDNAIAWIERQCEQKVVNNQFTPEQASVLDKHIDRLVKQKSAWSEEFAKKNVHKGT